MGLKKLFIFISVLLFSCSTFEERKFQFTYKVDLDPTDGKLELWLPVPQSNEVQTISNMKFDTGNLNYSVKDEKVHGNKYLYVSSDSGISESKTISITFDVERKEQSTQQFDGVDPSKYLGSYRTVPTGDIFKSIIDENKLSKNDMKAVYSFVLSGMHYGKPTDDENSGNYKYVHGGINPKTGKEWLPSDITYGLKKKTRDELTKSQNKSKQYAYGNGNSLYACNIGVGNCTDYHSYFMSLSRTLEVPARFHMGFPIPSDGSGVVGGYHCWADYYIDGKGWTPVDISEADKDPSKKDYFNGTICQNRVDVIVGRDFVLDGYDNGEINLFIYPQLEINDKVSSAYKKSFTYKNL